MGMLHTRSITACTAHNPAKWKAVWSAFVRGRVAAVAPRQSHSESDERPAWHTWAATASLACSGLTLLSGATSAAVLACGFTR
jgi:hypothetical protein